jgi:hypothetical protein
MPDPFYPSCLWNKFTRWLQEVPESIKDVFEENKEFKRLVYVFCGCAEMLFCCQMIASYGFLKICAIFRVCIMSIF